MITNSQIPKNLLPGLRTEFMKQYKQVPMTYTKVATVIPSTLPSETYGWLGQNPAVREFVGERIPKALSEFGFTVKNKKWEATLSVDQDSIEDEQYGQLKIRAAQLGESVAKHKNKLVWQTLAAGFTNLCYDGQYMFDTDHSENNSGTQSNKGTGALTAGTYGTARAAMFGFKDDQGEIIDVQPSLLIVPGALESTARTILNADFVSDGTTTISNVWKGSAELLVVPWLSDASDWFLIDDTNFMKPLIFQLRKDTEFKALDHGSDSERAFMRDENLFGTRGRYNVGYGDWRYAYGASV